MCPWRVKAACDARERGVGETRGGGDFGRVQSVISQWVKLQMRVVSLIQKGHTTNFLQSGHPGGYLVADLQLGQPRFIPWYL